MKISIFLIAFLVIFSTTYLLCNLFKSQPKTDDCTQIEKQTATVFMVSKKLPEEFGEIPLCVFETFVEAIKYCNHVGTRDKENMYYAKPVEFANNANDVIDRNNINQGENK